MDAVAGNQPSPKAAWWRRALAWLRQLVLGHDVFISYSRSDATAYATGLRERLRKHGLDVFLDEEQLEMGAHLPRRLQRAVAASDVLATLVSDGAIAQPHWLVQEIEHARSSWLSTAIAPVTFPPQTPGALAPPFDVLNSLRALADTREHLAAGTPADEIVTGLLELLGRRRVRRRRWIAAAATTAAIASVIAVLTTRVRASERERQVDHWLAVATQAESAERYHEAAYALARAAAISPAREPELRARYGRDRDRVQLALVGSITVPADARVAAVDGGEDAVRVLLANPQQLSIVDVRSGAGHTVACAELDRALSCAPGSFVARCGEVFRSIGRQDSSARDHRVPGTVLDARCVGDEARWLVETERGLDVVRINATETLGVDAVFASSTGPWLDAGVCEGAATPAFAARRRDDELTIAGPHPTPTMRRPGLVDATVIGSDGCDRFFIRYQVLDRSGDPLKPLGSTSGGWLLLEPSAMVVERELPAAIEQLVPAPRGANHVAAYRTANDELAFLPEVDAIVIDMAPVVVATGVSALTRWPSATDLSTMSIEGEALVHRRNGTVVNRHAAGISEPTRISVTRGTALVVEGANSAAVWRAVTSTGTDRIPSPTRVADDLGLRDQPR